MERRDEPIPIALGPVVCDSLIVEERTRNLSLINCFTTKRVREFRANDVRFTVVALLSDGEGDIPMTVCIERLDTVETIYLFSHTFTFRDRMQEVRFVLRVENCEFPVPGIYEIRLLADDEPVANQRIRVEPSEATT